MHPAPSVILFTTLSGLGFGLLTWLGFSPHAPTGLLAFAVFTLGFGAAVGGLAASTFHLGHPERAWRAFSQWKTSWLSREGLCAVAALITMGAYAIGLIFFDHHLVVLGWFGALLSLATVFTTAMIYTQLATVPRWKSPLTPVLFLTLSLTGGAMVTAGTTVVLPLLVLAGAVQIIWWLTGDGAFAARGSDLGRATGLGGLGSVRSMAHPHSSPNYLMTEFIYIVGRKHAQKLRALSLVFMCLLPALFLIICPANVFVTSLALLCHVAGVAMSRWLFFAQAEHVVGLYYGLR